MISMYRSIPVFSLIFLLVGSSSLFAQEEEKKDPEIEEAITVTARMREEAASDIPESITVLDLETIENAGVEQLDEIAWLVPNFHLSDGSHTGNITMTVRGISQVRNGESPVAVVVDGVNQPSPNSLNREYFDIEQVEVVRGPQGALYGRNAIGGAVVITTKTPTADAQQELHLGGGSGDYLVGGFRASGGISDRAFYSVSTHFEDRDGFIENVFLNEKADPFRNKSYNLRFTFLPTDRLSIDVKGYYSETDASGLYYVTGDFEGGVESPAYRVAMDVLGDNQIENTEFSLKLEYAADQFTITSVTSHHDFDEIIFGDLDYTPVSLLEGFQDLVTDGYSQEVRVSSKDDVRLRWMVGGYYLTYDRQLETSIDVDFSGMGDGFDFLFRTVDANDNDTTAFFGQVNYDITDQLELTGALRYDEDDRKQTDVLAQVAREDTFSSTQPKASLAYKFNDQSMAYVTYAEGFRSGGFNSPGRNAFSGRYEKEETQNYDLGFKTTFLNDRVRLNATYFKLDADNLQTIIFDQLTASQGILNIAGAESEGVEVDLSTKLTENWQFALGYGATDTEITAIDTSSSFYDSFPDDLTFVGNKLPSTPDWTLNATLQFTVPLGGTLQFLARGDYQHIDRMYWQTDNRDFRPVLDLGRARVGLKSPDWSFTFWVENLTDKRYNEEFFTPEYGAQQPNRFPSAPRRWGVEYRRRF
jgi:iron complex outermembrane receptor protein